VCYTLLMDDIQKNIQFILDMQAKHEAWLQRHGEAIARIDSAVESNAARIAQLVDVSFSLARHAEESDRRMELGFKELREIQIGSEHKLNALIDTVDKLVRHDGHTPE
jgi:hypothetical protein